MSIICVLPLKSAKFARAQSLLLFGRFQTTPMNATTCAEMFSSIPNEHQAFSKIRSKKTSGATKKFFFDFVGHGDSKPEVEVDLTFHGNHLTILVFRVWPWYSTWTIRVLQSCTQKRSVAVCEIWRVIYHFFRAIDKNLWLCGYGKSQRVGWHGFKTWWVLKLSARLGHFCVAPTHLNTTIWLPLFWKTWTLA